MGYIVNKRRFKQLGPVEYTVTILISGHITHTGGNLIQTVSGPITPITLSPEDTYRINQGSGTYYGISVLVSGRDIVISGTPTKNVSIIFNTTQNADILTSTQKNFANWNKSNTYSSYGFLYVTVWGQQVSSTYIPWQVKIQDSTFSKNEGYYYDLSSLPFDTHFQLSLTYKVETVGSYSNYGCKIGICTNNRSGNMYRNMLGYISIPLTQAEYTTETVNITRPSSASNCYIAIVNSSYTSQYTQYLGKIHVQEMTLRQI